MCYANLVGLGSDGANVMLGTRNSVLTRLKAKQPSFHCNCHLAALIANHACKAMADYLEDVTIQIGTSSRKAQSSTEHFKSSKRLLIQNHTSYSKLDKLGG